MERSFGLAHVSNFVVPPSHLVVLCVCWLRCANVQFFSCVVVQLCCVVVQLCCGQSHVASIWSVLHIGTVY